MEQKRIASLDILILCGGFGTRLKEAYKDGPKPMVEIHGRPFLDILIQYVSSFGFRRFILCTGFKSEVVEEYFHNKNDSNTYIISKEPEALGTGGGIKNAEPFILGSPFMVLNGDSICRVNLKEFVEFHESRNASASLTLTEINDMKEYGAVTINNKQEVNGFKEKSTQTITPGLVNAGVYLFEKKLLSKLAVQRKVSLEHEVLPFMIGQGIFGFVTEQNLYDIGTPKKLELLRNHLR
jgi:NDP-sugar pyrophosphorylase family protein|tara:strand:- start:1797 stop:2510 length:714 start_codon:yes stop_codon:yes gene_type:complete